MEILTDSQLVTLCALLKASVAHSAPLALRDAYMTLPNADLEFLVSEGYWYIVSATQGQLTKRGENAIRFALREKLIEENKRKSN